MIRWHDQHYGIFKKRPVLKVAMGQFTGHHAHLCAALEYPIGYRPPVHSTCRYVHFRVLAPEARH